MPPTSLNSYSILNFFHFTFCVNFTDYHITTAFHQALVKGTRATRTPGLPGAI